MKPAGSTGAIVSYGNATTPFIGSPVAIESRIGIGAPTMNAPGFSAPRMPILERLTPHNVNATRGINTARARVTAITARAVKRTTNFVTGYARALATRQR